MHTLHEIKQPSIRNVEHFWKLIMAQPPQTAFERLQQDPFYLQRAAQATVHDLHQTIAPHGAFQTRSLWEAATVREGEQRTLQAPTRAPLRTIRDGRMPENAYFTPSALREFGLDPANQRVRAPTRRRRWNNAPGTFVMPEPIPEYRPGYKRVIKWQDYEQDKIQAQLGYAKNPVQFGQRMVGYTRAPVEYRKLTEAEMRTRGAHAHTLFEDEV